MCSLAAICGCQNLPDPRRLPGIRPAERVLTEEELRVKLTGLAATTSGVISAAADEIQLRTGDRTIRRRTLLWQREIIPLVRRAAYIDDPQHGYVAELAVIVAMRQYLDGGQGATLFGEHQAIAVAAAHELEEDAWELGSEFLGDDERERLRGEIDRLAREHPIRGEFSPGALVGALASPEAQTTIAWIVDFPMRPFRVFSGVNEGAQAIREFNEIALQLTQLFAELPRVMRWEIELLLYDAEDRATTRETLASLASFAESAERLSLVAETLTESQSALGQEVQDLAEPLGVFAREVRAAGDSWGALVRDVREMGDAGERDPDARPFDILEYERTARELQHTAASMQAVIGDLHELVRTPEVPAVLSGIEAGGQSLVDAAAWRLLQLMLLFFALLLGYRFVSARIGRA